MVGVLTSDLCQKCVCCAQGAGCPCCLGELLLHKAFAVVMRLTLKWKLLCPFKKKSIQACREFCLLEYISLLHFTHEVTISILYFKFCVHPAAALVWR